MSDTEIRMMRYTIEQLSAELQATRQYVSDIEQKLERTRKELEQSETCCTEWEKQALDYKAENIALSGDLERTRKALDVAVDALKRIDETRSGVKENLHATNGRTLNAGNGFCWATIDDIHNALEQITALEQKDK